MKCENIMQKSWNRKFTQPVMRMCSHQIPKYWTSSSMMSECRWQSQWTSNLMLSWIMHHAKNKTKVLLKCFYFPKVMDEFVIMAIEKYLIGFAELIMYVYSISFVIFLFHVKIPSLASKMLKRIFIWVGARHPVFMIK